MLRKIHKSSKLSFFLDYRIFIPVIVLSVIGLFAIMDVSAPKAMETFSDKFYFVKQQFAWTLIGIALFFFLSQLNVKIYEKFALHIFFVALVLLIMVLIPSIGVKTLGAQRWIDLGFIGFQPSEFVKLAICIYLAKISSVKKNIMAFILPIGIISLLVMMQPDLGTTAVIFSISFVQIFLSDIPVKKFLAAIIIGLFFVSAAIFISPYRRERVMAFTEPFSETSDSNYHIKQVLFALALGGFDGTGIGESKQKYLFLPESTTDSIFAVIGEETGLLGVTVIITLFFVISFNMLKNIPKLENDYSRSLGIGIATWFTSQVFINLGSIVSLIPFTGVPLPFISYGGSSLVGLFAGMGIYNSLVKYSA